MSWLTKLNVCKTGKHYNCLQSFVRFLSSSEVSVALRPLYFAVHPDLFQQHPQERDTNENSLKQLHNYLETLIQCRPVSPANVKFFLRQGQSSSVQNFKAVNIPLAQRDIHVALETILSSCSLPTESLKNLPKRNTAVKTISEFKKDQEWMEDDFYEAKFKVSSHRDKPVTLTDWLKRHADDSRQRIQACQPVREEISRLQAKLCKELKLADLRWECGWGTSHFRGCIQSFNLLVTHHREDLRALEGRTVVFGNESGISLQGHVILNSGEVRHNWLDLIRNLHKNEIPLKRVPSLEAALSRSLCDIKVTQRIFRPQLLAEAYESRLRALTTGIGDYRSRYGFPKEWSENLRDYHLVVEGEAGPLMLSPSGQFITPSSCPISLLVSFINKNLNNARALLKQYRDQVEKEKELITECIRVYGLSGLGKDDNVTPLEMSECCRHLINQQNNLHSLLGGSRLRITKYYSLLSDGEMCIPWNAN